MDNIPERSHLTAEDMPAIRQEIGALREQKGKEQETLALIRPTREAARLLGLHEDVVDLFWEECLTAKHMLMNNPRDELARPLFKTAAMAADAYIEENHVESKRPRSQLFLGQAAMLEGEDEEAVKRFTEGINLFEGSSDPDERENALELRGCLAEALIRAGRIEDGIHEGFDVLSDYDKDAGASLRERDYYRWAVWKSGVSIKVWEAVLDNGIHLSEEERGKLSKALDEAQEILSGNFDFQYRKDQISRIRKRL